jgi:hypothetical protein
LDLPLIYRLEGCVRACTSGFSVVGVGFTVNLPFGRLREGLYLRIFRGGGWIYR